MNKVGRQSITVCLSVYLFIYLFVYIFICLDLSVSVDPTYIGR